MGRTPCCEKIGLNRGKWTAEEDEKLVNYIKANGEGSWRSLPKNAGLLRCGKSCRLRWINYLRTDVKRGNFSEQEEEMIVKLHNTLGNRWSLIASQIPGRTDNEIKNYWNSHLSRKTYRYRFIGEATLSTADMINMAKNKKTTARPRLHNQATNSKSRLPPNAPSNADQPSSSDRPPAAPAVPLETDEDNRDLPASAINEEGVGWPDAFMLSPDEVDHEILLHLNYFLEDDSTDQCHNQTDRLIMMDTPNSPTAQERDCGGGRDASAWSSSLDCVELYACLSPIVYFTDDVQQWEHSGAGNQLNLWNEEEEDDSMIWS